VARDVRVPLVLLAGLHEDPLAMYAITLLAAGFQPLTATSATEAFSLACAFQPAVVVADAELSGESGVTLARRLRADDRTKHAAIIILAGGDAAATTSEAIGAGCDRVAVKPCPPDALAAKIHTLLRNRPV
jgi:two-component system, OmpR family, phosphate regulon response regulator PhoB